LAAWLARALLSQPGLGTGQTHVDTRLGLVLAIGQDRSLGNAGEVPTVTIKWVVHEDAAR
jgi:hypothetical protein